MGGNHGSINVARIAIDDSEMAASVIANPWMLGFHFGAQELQYKHSICPRMRSRIDGRTPGNALCQRS